MDSTKDIPSPKPRSDAQQRIIDRVGSALPMVGYPETIIDDDRHGVVVIAGVLHCFDANYTHPEYRVGGRRQRVTVLERSGLRVLACQDLRFPCGHIAVHPVERLLLLSTAIGWDSFSGQLVVLDVDRDRQHEVFRRSGPVRKCSIDPSGDRVEVLVEHAVHYMEDHMRRYEIDLRGTALRTLGVDLEATPYSVLSEAEADAIEDELDALLLRDELRLQQLGALLGD